MGFFSKCCAKTHLPILTIQKEVPRLSTVVALLPDGTKRQGIYDGYGRVDGVSVMADADGRDIWKKVKFVLLDHYNGEAYHDLGPSGDELAQGFFMHKDFILYCLMHGAFKNRAQYVRAFKKYAAW